MAPKSTTIYVMPNPYGHLDHRGWLAGGVGEAEGVRPVGAMPARRFIGASYGMIEGTLDLGKTLPDGSRERGPGSTLQPRAEYEWAFQVDRPVAVTVTPELQSYYLQRIASDELFEVSDDKTIPLEKLAEARVRAVERFRAERGLDAKPPFKKWAQQFPMDEVVAELAGDIEKVRAEEQEHAKRGTAKAAAAEKVDMKALAAQQLGKARQERAERHRQASPTPTTATHEVARGSRPPPPPPPTMPRPDTTKKEG